MSGKEEYPELTYEKALQLVCTFINNLGIVRIGKGKKTALVLATGCTWARLFHFIKLSGEYYFDYRLISGGTAWANEMNAIEAKSWLASHYDHSPINPILIETTSTNSKEQAINTYNLLRRKDDVDSVTLVACDWHMCRLFLTFKRQWAKLGNSIKISCSPVIYQDWDYPYPWLRNQNNPIAPPLTPNQLARQEAERIVKYRTQGDL